jgi:hypothetical protein
MKKYREEIKALNNAAWQAVRGCPYNSSHPTKSALIRIAWEINDLFDDETWDVGEG